MRTRLLPGLCATSLLLVFAGAPACGGGEGGATSSSASTTDATTTGTGGASASDGNDDFATAEAITVDTTVEAFLEPSWKDQDFYVLHGTKGQAIAISTHAEETPFDVHTIDTVLTLFDAAKNPIAGDDDPTPRASDDAQLFTILPADGDYYVRVAECWSWAPDTSACAKPKGKVSTGYTLRISSLASAGNGVVHDLEKGNDAASATAVTYSDVAKAGVKPLSIVYGRFETPDDVDVFSFDFPVDITIVAPGSRLVATEWILRAGPDGDGSTTAPGKVYITTQADPMTRLAQIDSGDYGGRGSRLWPPLDVAGKYYLFVEHPKAPLGANDFYVALHGANGSRPVEQKEIENDAPATPEPLVATEEGSFFIEGDLVNGAADVDHFSFDVSQSAGLKVAVACASARAGAGLVGFEIDLLDATTLAPLALVKETPQTDAVTPATPVPAGASTMILKLRADAQDPLVSGTYYRCGVHFQ